MSCRLHLAAQSQSNINQVWQKQTGQPSELFNFSSSIHDSSGDIYLLGNHTLANGNVALLLEKFSEDGQQFWNQSWQCDGNHCVFVSGVDMVEQGGYLYITGVLQDVSTITDLSVFVQKYNASTGQRLWSRRLDYNNSPLEFPIDAQVYSNELELAGNSKNAFSMDMENYPSGIYTLQLSTSQGIISTKIIKQ